ncbi:MAG: glycosyltransferase [Desulfarculaceae bacterium]|nr:glycosyltransferase [Desulfarculaceae bacterium]
MVFLIIDPYGEKGGGAILLKTQIDILRKLRPEDDFIIFKTKVATRNKFASYFLQFLNVTQKASIIKKADLVIICSVYQIENILIARKLKSLNIPYILLPKGDFPPHVSLNKSINKYVIKKFLWGFFIRNMMNNATRLVTTSHNEIFWYKCSGYSSNRYAVISNPLDINFNPISEFNKEQRERPLVLWLGRYSPEKNLEFLLESWKLVVHEIPEAVLFLAGYQKNKKYVNKIRRRIQRYNLQNNVILSDWLNLDFKQQLLDLCNCLVLPSHYESFGNVVLEAISSNTPVVVSDNTPWRDLPNQIGACIPLCREDWARWIIRYINSNEDISAGINLRKKYLEKFEYNVIMSNWNRLLEAVCSEIATKKA